MLRRLKAFVEPRQTPRFTALLFALLCSSAYGFAKEITPNKALEIAKRYITPAVVTQKSRATRATSAAASTPFYLYNDKRGQGFVIVSADDVMGEVLAYSTKGSLDTTKLNPEARFLLQQYREVYRALQQYPQTKSRALVASSQTDEVAPLLKSHWGQGEPYNQQTQYVTGCVATAMAQLMYFHQWPKRGQGENSYTVAFDHTQRTANFAASEYAWKQMLPDYLHVSYTQQQANAVAKLMSDVGISVFMQYTSGASSASNYAAAQAFRNHFDYDVAMITKQDEGTSHFLEIIQSELRKGFPLYISGNSKNNAAGHAWVADGFDRNGMVHMNFGWDGQADGFYSLSALSLSTSGKEFNGRLLAFNRQLMVMAVHPNRQGTPPIDEQLREGAPNLAFTIEGDMHFTETPPTTTGTETHITINHFTNQSSQFFCGDLGIGIFSADDSPVRICPSTFHEAGGYTVSRFADYGGKMSPSALINEDVTIPLKLSGLADGQYTLSAVACERHASGDFGSWTKLKKAPRIVFKVEAGHISYLEMPSTAPAFQLMAAPTFDKPLYSGAKNTAHVMLRKLNALPFDGVVSLEFIGSDGLPAATFTTEKSVDFEMFATTRVTLPLSLPEHLTPGDYELRLSVIKDYTQETCIVRSVNMQAPTHVNVEQRDQRDVLFSNVLGIVQDNSGESIPADRIDQRTTPLFKLGCIAFSREQAEYTGPITLQLVDDEGKRSIILKTVPNAISLNHEANTLQIMSGWLRASDLKIINNRDYRLTLTGKQGDKVIDLWPEDVAPFVVSIVNGPYNQYPDNGTDGIDEVAQAADVRFNGSLLEVSQEGLQRVAVYHPSGILVANKDIKGQNHMAIALPRGLYLVKITTQKGSFTKVVR